MWLNDSDSMVGNKLFEMFVKMAIVIVAKIAVVKFCRRSCQFFDRFPDTQNLQGLFAGNTRGGLGITLQGSCADSVLVRQVFN